MDRHVERAEALGDHTLGVELGEARQGGEVAVEEGQPIVVILEVEALPHALGQLVDEAELAVVVAGADLVEHGGVDSGTQWLAGVLRHANPPIDRSTDASDEQLEVCTIGHLLPLDDIERLRTIDRQHLVAHEEAGQLGRRARGDVADPGCRHPASLRGSMGCLPGPRR